MFFIDVELDDLTFFASVSAYHLDEDKGTYSIYKDEKENEYYYINEDFGTGELQYIEEDEVIGLLIREQRFDILEKYFFDYFEEI